MKEYTLRVDALDKKTQKKEEAEEKQKSAPNDYVEVAQTCLAHRPFGAGAPCVGRALSPPERHLDTTRSQTTFQA